MAEEQVECSLLQHPYREPFKSISSPGNDLDALTDLSADEVEALQALEVLRSANPPAAACCDARSSLSGASTSSTLSSSLLGPDSTPRKRLPAVLAASFANWAATGVGSAGEAATNSSAQPPSNSTMGLQQLQQSTAARSAVQPLARAKGPESQHGAAHTLIAVNPAAAVSQGPSGHREQLKRSSVSLKLESSDCPARSSSAPGKGWLRDRVTSEALARSAAAPRWSNWIKAGQAPAVQQAAAAEDGGQNDTKASSSRRSSKKGAKQQQQQQPPTKDLKGRQADLGKEAGEYVHTAVHNVYQVVSELKAGKGADLVFPCSAEGDETGSGDQEAPCLSSKKAFEDALHKLPRYMQTSLTAAANKLLDDPSPGGPLRWGQALGTSLASYLNKRLPNKQSVEDAKQDRLQLAILCCSTLQQLKSSRRRQES